MADKGLATYLEDHLAGATGALDLLKHIREQYADETLSVLLDDLYAEIAKDRSTLESLSRRIGRGEHSMKEMAARVGEKLSRWKLARELSGALGTFEALEVLALGIWGKRFLWRALKMIAPSDPRLLSEELDFDQLIGSAEAQHERVDALRLQMAPQALLETATADSNS